MLHTSDRAVSRIQVFSPAVSERKYVYTESPTSLAVSIAAVRLEAQHEQKHEQKSGRNGLRRPTLFSLLPPRTTAPSRRPFVQPQSPPRRP